MPVDLSGNAQKQLDEDLFGLDDDQWDLNEDIKEEQDEGESNDDEPGESVCSS